MPASRGASPRDLGVTPTPSVVFDGHNVSAALKDLHMVSKLKRVLTLQIAQLAEGVFTDETVPRGTIDSRHIGHGPVCDDRNGPRLDFFCPSVLLYQVANRYISF
ncbi:MAG: hypothetical protein M3548_07710 [Actinomycetota bacterium]|nr:hypothetical protein [Actinomycetota bacterium]